MEQGTKQRASTGRGVDSTLGGVDSDQVELNRALRELARIPNREQHFMVCWWHGIQADSGFGRASSSVVESTQALIELTRIARTDSWDFCLGLRSGFDLRILRPDLMDLKGTNSRGSA